LLAVLRAKKVTIVDCAKRLKVHKSTISRELKRNTLPSRKRKPKYLPNTAQKLYENRRKDCKPKVKLYTKVELRKKIIIKLQKGWSPATIVGRMKEIEKVETVYHKTIYKFIYGSEIGKLNKLFEYLPYGKK
jgi:IS30 family transposase